MESIGTIRTLFPRPSTEDALCSHPPPSAQRGLPFTRRESSRLFKTPVKRPARTQAADTPLLSAPRSVRRLGGRRGVRAQRTATPPSLQQFQRIEHEVRRAVRPS